jgi:predicted alpha/beta-fold hydrolase
LIKELSKEFKCVYLQYRGQSGIPVTSNKLYSAASWLDIKEVVEHLHSTHFSERSMYIYGVSLGGSLIAKYLVEDAQNTPIKGAAFYGAPLNLTEDNAHFENSLYGNYTYIFGLGFCNG